VSGLDSSPDCSIHTDAAVVSPPDQAVPKSGQVCIAINSATSSIRCTANPLMGCRPLSLSLGYMGLREAASLTVMYGQIEPVDERES
jgi:hypothetical protein